MDKVSSRKQNEKKSDGQAVASLTLGILSLTGFGLFTGIPAIILAAITLNRQTTNRGFSLAGLITGIVGTVISILIIAFFFLILLLPSGQTEPAQFSPQSGSNVDQPTYYPNI